MENYEEKMDVVEVEETEATKEKQVPEKTKGDEYAGAFIVGFIGGAATALGKAAVDWAIPKIKDMSEKAAEKRKAKRAERKRAKEQKKLDKLIEAQKAKEE